jgi:Ca2+-binding RTX toxin-like protein
MPTATSHIDSLEARRLLSAALVNGVLVVEGTSASDDIRVYRMPGPTDAPAYAVEIGPVNGKGPTFFWTFPADQVASVVVRAGPGDDTVDLATATFALPALVGYGPVTVPDRVDGGLGNDTLYGGMSRSFLFGSFGSDQISGGGGNDWVDGGWGDDRLDGSAGGDYVSGGYGNDFVYGGEGDDRLFGGPGNDHVGYNGVGPTVSEPGNDLLVGGTGEDWMVGGQGTDRIYGGPGRDHFSLEDAEPEKLDRTPDEPNDVPIFD